jgi:5-methylcytosine-specific restriction endonuclease McrA
MQPQSVGSRTFEKQRPVTSDTTEVKFLMTDELKAQLDQVRTLLGPKAVGMGFAELFSVMATLSAEKLAEKKFGKRRVASASEQASKPSETVPEVERVNHTTTPARASETQVISKGSKNPRYISQATKHAVWLRDGNRCCLCGSSHNLNLDHIHPVALGGTSSIENLRLLCFSCNQRQAIKTFGLATVEQCASSTR